MTSWTTATGPDAEHPDSNREEPASATMTMVLFMYTSLRRWAEPPSEDTVLAHRPARAAAYDPRKPGGLCGHARLRRVHSSCPGMPTAKYGDQESGLCNASLKA